MEVYLNELSTSPLAKEHSVGRERISGLLKTMKSLRESNFTVLRTHDGFFGDPIAEGYSCLDFLKDDSVPRIQKELLQTICRNPFIVDDDSAEAEFYILNSFDTIDHTNTVVVPEGLAAAHIHGCPVAGFDSHPHWREKKLSLNVYDSNGVGSQESIWNFWNDTGIEVWKEEKKDEIPLNSEDNIYKIFPKAKIEFEARAIGEMIAWFYDDERYQKRIIKLIADIPAHPFLGGMGKTEGLVSENRMASKRISEKDRLVYTYEEDKITIHSCRGHYDDH